MTWSGNTDHMETREEHYEKFFGSSDEKVMHSTDVKDVHIDVYQFPPTIDRPFWTLVTGGMSDLRQPGIASDEVELRRRAEILMYVKEPQGWMFSVLKGLAEMPFDACTFLYWHHTVPNGMPMTAEPSELTSYFFLPPYPEDPAIADFEIDGDPVSFLWMIPITEAERAYAVEKGSEALEEVLRLNDMDQVLDEHRQSFV